MAIDDEQPLKILIAEDSAPDRLILESIVSQAGHNPITVADGVQAVQSFESQRPDIVLLDVLMPNMGGIQAAREIRALSVGELVPIIFLTSLSDAESLVECLDAGGDDFLSKPYNRVVLQSKLRAFGRMRDMHSTLAEQKNEIEKHHNHLIQEQTVAKQVFDKIAHTGCLDLANIRHYMSPLAVFNGDVLVAEVSPNGSMIVLLGDFTGHGLPAAIGSMPLASTFYGMVRKGFSMSEILSEVNSKLHQILPVGFFCCATCIDINFVKRRLKVWTGGLPSSFLYRAATNSYEVIQSKNLPLGVLASKDFKAECMRIQLDVDDRFYMWSDGIVESRNAKGEMFGEDRLNDIMNRKVGQSDLFDSILNDVHDHIGASEKDDDISLVEIVVEDVELVSNYEKSGREGQLVDWSMNFEVTEASLKEFDPLPLLLNVISEVPGLRQNSSMLYTVLSELYANALDHGVLGLPSDLKATPSGFADYYKMRQERLINLDSGFVRFNIKHNAEGEGGKLVLRVQDSGKGFDWKSMKLLNKNGTGDSEGDAPKNIIAGSRNLHGRGLPLIASICEHLEVHEPGNDVEIHFRWRYED